LRDLFFCVAETRLNTLLKELDFKFNQESKGLSLLSKTSGFFPLFSVDDCM